ncbi:hypothetical protein PILCRDRAFT_16636 [Piloderma croceum F 1598]|uniref:Ubiquitin-like domain-containing protein n=1 Tax=Piloderma croceum (strain F 1598) TaxID=765440 RepID=A0A0C3B3M2_PILCF|nr:hypothetical protein PILCRDRAFT_16636 [Piloderma croceum F 1598]
MPRDAPYRPVRKGDTFLVRSGTIPRHGDPQRQVEDVCLPPPDEHRLIFPGKQLGDALKARGDTCLPQSDQQRLIFSGKRPRDASKARGNLEDMSTIQGDACLPPPDQQRLIFAGKRLEDASITQGDVGGESTIFEFQGNKLLEGATNVDARHSNYNRVSGDQFIVDRRVDVNTVIVIENVTIVIENVEGTSSRTSPSMKR